MSVQTRVTGQAAQSNTICSKCQQSQIRKIPDRSVFSALKLGIRR